MKIFLKLKEDNLFLSNVKDERMRGKNNFLPSVSWLEFSNVQIPGYKPQ